MVEHVTFQQVQYCAGVLGQLFDEEFVCEMLWLDSFSGVKCVDGEYEDLGFSESMEMLKEAIYILEEGDHFEQ